MSDSRSVAGPLVLTVAAVAGIAALAGAVIFFGLGSDTYEVEYTTYGKPEPPPGPTLENDRLEDKNPEFDAELIDSRPLDGWDVNASAAVIRLHCPMIKPDQDPGLLELHASYSAAESKDETQHALPSANLIDGANKQFDDGLFAALEVATFRGSIAAFPAVPQLVQQIAQKLPSESPARPFLAAALSLAGQEIELTADEQAACDRYLADFKSDESRSKPISFYNWTEELQTIWRVYRFLQTEMSAGVAKVKSPADELQIARDIAAVLEADPKLRESYTAATGFYMSLTNPASCLSMDALIGAGDRSLTELAEERGARRATIAFLPPSTSRETELFSSLFPRGLPSGANLMAEMIAAVRSGRVDLAPGENDGWYQHQVFALETMLLPSKGQEEQKLLLNKSYKERLVQAFKALVTKRRETHVRGTDVATTSEAAPFNKLGFRPRLRIEPCVTYYLRTARAYGFVQNFLASVVGDDTLAELHGLTTDGARESSLKDELESVRQRAYGFYLISCEDIGLRPELAEGELADPRLTKQLALNWLMTLSSNLDLKRDTRVAVPIHQDRRQRQTRIWVTLGVRQTKLTATYARPPMVRNEEEPDWKTPQSYQLNSGNFLIAVDEFAEVTIPGLTCPNRKELRKLCDEKKTKEAIVEALQNGEWK
ncbi:MAG: hypothetical protein O2820_14995 [Planctomycetota bacterium]|nr:hypothetical protein [Planctomycetota bacterium]MDA1250521.1 hypothetical protein [Planctomycetota bacterium]